MATNVTTIRIALDNKGTTGVYHVDAAELLLETLKRNPDERDLFVRGYARVFGPRVLRGLEDAALKAETIAWWRRKEARRLRMIRKRRVGHF